MTDAVAGQDQPAGPTVAAEGVSDRVTRLEVDRHSIRRDLDEIKEQLKLLPQLATKRDLDTWRWSWLAIGIGIVALTVGGITGGLSLIAGAVR